MEKFINEDFLLENDYSRELYHDYAEKLPLIDFHCHLDPKEICEDKHWTISRKLGLGPTITNGAQCVPTESRSAIARGTLPTAKNFKNLRRPCRACWAIPCTIGAIWNSQGFSA